MSWQWFFSLWSKLFKPLRMHLCRHRVRAFRVLLFGGNLLLLLVLWGFQPVFQHYREYYVWLAGLSATLGLLFVFTIVSALINGYRRYHDSWLGLATGLMFVLSFALAVAAVYH